MRITLTTSKEMVIFFRACIVIAVILILAGIGYLIYEQYYINKVVETYKILQDSYQKTIKTSNFQWEYGKMNTALFADALTKNLPVEKNCKRTNKGECFPPQIYFTKDALQTKGIGLSMYYPYKVLLKNGVGLAIGINDVDCSLGDDRCGEIYIDANGPQKGPNRLSRDIFDVAVFKDRIEAYDIRGNHFPNCVYGGGHACGAYLLKFRNRNYKSYERYVKRHHLVNTNMNRQ